MLNGIYQVEQVKKTIKFYPSFKYLYFVLKFYLRQRNLNDTYMGGVGSFLLFCMILAFLRETRRKNSKEMGLGEILMNFFNFYSSEFDYAKNTIIMRSPGKIVKKPYSVYKFSLIHP